jgi:glycosyltransferase involved in cell wall biosynthesis
MDDYGGAARVATSLLVGQRSNGLDARIAVGFKGSDVYPVFELKEPSTKQSYLGRYAGHIHKRLCAHQNKFKGIWRLVEVARYCSMTSNERDYIKGYEQFHYPASRKILELPDFNPDVVHLHNLHGYYFDLRFLPELSRRAPTVITLHDEWLLTGHCAYTLGCERWTLGCGSCPDISIYPKVAKDKTRFNLERKKRIYRNSKLHIAAPSHWLLERAKASALYGSEFRHIPYGIDLSIFNPGDRSADREKLGYDRTCFIVLFASAGAENNKFKDYSTITNAIDRLASLGMKTPVKCIIMGGKKQATFESGCVSIVNLPYIKKPEEVASYYRVADVFLHAARAENFPNAILEAMGCGTPVIATRVGGIPEQIEHGRNGFLVESGGSEEMADAIVKMLNNRSVAEEMGRYAAQLVARKYALQQHVEAYSRWYEEILCAHKHT